MGSLMKMKNLVFARLVACRIRTVTALPVFKDIVVLDLQENKITSLNFSAFWSQLPHLSVLNLQNNKIMDKAHLRHLKCLQNLVILQLQGNEIKGYMREVLELLPQLIVLDDSIITNMSQTEVNDKYLDSQFFLQRQKSLSYTIYHDTDQNVYNYSMFMLQLNRQRARLCPVLILQRYFRMAKQIRVLEYIKQHFGQAVFKIQAYYRERKRRKVLIKYVRSCFAEQTRRVQQLQQLGRAYIKYRRSHMIIILRLKRVQAQITIRRCWELRMRAKHGIAPHNANKADINPRRLVVCLASCYSTYQQTIDIFCKTMQLLLSNVQNAAGIAGWQNSPFEQKYINIRHINYQKIFVSNQRTDTIKLVPYATRKYRERFELSNRPFFLELEITHPDASILLFYLMVIMDIIKFDREDKKLMEAFKFGDFICEQRLKPLEQGQAKIWVKNGVAPGSVMEHYRKNIRQVITTPSNVREIAAAVQIQQFMREKVSYASLQTIFSSHDLRCTSMRGYMQVSRATVMIQKFMRRKTAYLTQTLLSRMRQCFCSAISHGKIFMTKDAYRKLQGQLFKRTLLWRSLHVNLSDLVTQELGVTLFSGDVMSPQFVELYGQMFYGLNLTQKRQFALLTTVNSELYNNLLDGIYAAPQATRAIISVRSSWFKNAFDAQRLRTWAGAKRPFQFLGCVIARANQKHRTTDQDNKDVSKLKNGKQQEQENPPQQPGISELNNTSQEFGRVSAQQQSIDERQSRANHDLLKAGLRALCGLTGSSGTDHRLDKVLSEQTFELLPRSVDYQRVQINMLRGVVIDEQYHYQDLPPKWGAVAARYFGKELVQIRSEEGCSPDDLGLKALLMELEFFDYQNINVTDAFYLGRRCELQLEKQTQITVDGVMQYAGVVLIQTYFRGCLARNLAREKKAENTTRLVNKIYDLVTRDHVYDNEKNKAAMSCAREISSIALLSTVRQATHTEDAAQSPRAASKSKTRVSGALVVHQQTPSDESKTKAIMEQKKYNAAQVAAQRIFSKSVTKAVKEQALLFKKLTHDAVQQKLKHTLPPMPKSRLAGVRSIAPRLASDAIKPIPLKILPEEKYLGTQINQTTLQGIKEPNQALVMLKSQANSAASSSLVNLDQNRLIKMELIKRQALASKIEVVPRQRAAMFVPRARSLGFKAQLNSTKMTQSSLDLQQGPGRSTTTRQLPSSDDLLGTFEHIDL